MSTNYETHAVTKMVATHCDICNRPLKVASSVNNRLGPCCAKRYMAKSTVLMANWDSFVLAMAPVKAIPRGIAEALTRATVGEKAEDAANTLLRAIAEEPKGANMPHYLKALDALGYKLAAERVAERLLKREEEKPIVFIEERADGYLSVRTPYTAAIVEGFRAIPGRRWSPKDKVNLIPARPDAKRQLFSLLQVAFPNALASGPKGNFTITPA